MKFHKYADLFPLIVGEEFRNLVEDIRVNGLLEPIWLHNELVIDGRNRYRACKELGIEPKTRNYTGKDPLSFVVSTNLIRRHLDASQRAILGVRLEPLYAEEAAERQAAAGGKDPGPLPPNLAEAIGEARDKAAAIVGVSHSYISMAKAMVAAAPELEEIVLARQLPLGQAYEIAQATPSEDGRKKLIKKALEEKLSVAKTRSLALKLYGTRKEKIQDREKEAESAAARVEEYYEGIRIEGRLVKSPELHAKWMNFAEQLVDFHEKRSE